MEIRANCLICRSENLTTLLHFKKYPFSEFIVASIAGLEVEFRPLIIMGCNTCGTIQNGHEYDINDLGVLYQDADIYDTTKFANYSYVDENDFIIKRVLKYIPSEYSTVLEIGCGSCTRIDVLNRHLKNIFRIDPAVPTEPRPYGLR